MWWEIPLPQGTHAVNFLPEDSGPVGCDTFCHLSVVVDVRKEHVPLFYKSCAVQEERFSMAQ